MLCVLCVLFSFCAVPLNNTAPCHKREVNGKVYYLLNNYRAQGPTFWLQSPGNCSRGWRGLVGGCSCYIQNIYQIYFIKRYQIIFFINMITRKKGKTWEREAKKNIYIDFVWFIDLVNPNYPHLGKRASDGTLEPWNQKKWKVPQLKKMHLCPSSWWDFFP
jgi:hypothetical protein